MSRICYDIKIYIIICGVVHGQSSYYGKDLIAAATRQDKALARSAVHITWSECAPAN